MTDTEEDGGSTPRAHPTPFEQHLCGSADPTDWGVLCRRQRLALALALRALALADRAAEALATIDNCSTALRSVRTDLTDRDKLRPWAPGNRHRR
jgi:hypothetical protein